MSAGPTRSPRDEVIEEVSTWTVGLGIVTMALFPLSLPILILTAVFLAPLVLPLIAIGILALPVLLVRRVLRAIRKRRAPKGPPRTSEPESAAPWLEGARPVRGSETCRPVVPRT
jgi:hypothetical protein